MVDQKVQNHTHNGNDSKQIEFTDLNIFPEDNIAQPIGGTVIDIPARKAIDKILKLLQNKGLMK